jgi:hypothetical protein
VSFDCYCKKKRRVVCLVKSGTMYKLSNSRLCFEPPAFGWGRQWKEIWKWIGV